ncbi:protein NYNRIN-like [Sparus aurata]|uniref:protein NYNRIN-like n=1 Tax=Sparus aurata TaxID=8175 RepID=UPI0011C0D23A|nr:protein NYNRIN-like [Sparus aurata]
MRQLNKPQPCVGPLLVAEDCEPLTTLSSLIAAQNMAGIYEQSVWLKRGATKTTQEGPHKGLWRSVHGHFVLPTALLKIAISDAHGSDHCARGEVIRRLQTVWWAPFLASTVDKTLVECDICAHHNVRKAFSAPIAHIPPPSGPFRHLMMDHIDMTERVRGFRYILVVVDRFSRWVEAVPTKGPDCRSAAKFQCREVFPRFGLPDCISSGNRPSFVADMMKVAMKMLGIKQKFGCVYHPQSQGVVERANGTLKAKLAKIMADSKYKFKWVDALPLALMSMRTQANRQTHLTPHEMMTGRPMPVPYFRGPYNGPPLEQCEKELTNYLQHLTQIHKVIFQQVKSATEERDADIPDAQQRIVPGDWVYVKVFKRKWDQPRRQGPFKVTLATPTALKVEDKSCGRTLRSQTQGQARISQSSARHDQYQNRNGDQACPSDRLGVVTGHSTHWSPRLLGPGPTRMANNWQPPPILSPAWGLQISGLCCSPNTNTPVDRPMTDITMRNPTLHRFSSTTDAEWQVPLIMHSDIPTSVRDILRP